MSFFMLMCQQGLRERFCARLRDPAFIVKAINRSRFSACLRWPHNEDPLGLRRQRVRWCEGALIAYKQ